MGYCSNQWLNRGQRTRSRSHYPVPVVVECEHDTSTFSEVKVKFIARKKDGQLQILYLSETEIDAAAEKLISCLSNQGGERLAFNLVEQLSHHLSEAEVGVTCQNMMSRTPQQKRESLLQTLLRDLSDKKLLKALAIELSKRVRLPKDR